MKVNGQTKPRIATTLETPSIWSVDRIARLIVGITNILLLLATYLLSPYFLIGLCFVNLNLVLTSVTDQCPFKNFLKKLGAKEREQFFNSNGELIQVRVSNDFALKVQPSEKA